MSSELDETNVQIAIHHHCIREIDSFVLVAEQIDIQDIPTARTTVIT